MSKKINDKKETGYIISYFSGVAKIKGLTSVFLNEVLLDKKNNPTAFVIGFGEGVVEALFFNDYFDITQPIYRSSKIFSINISENIIGRVIGGLGEPKDGFGNLIGDEFPVFRSAPSIIDREPVSIPLTTGIKVIDTSLTLGRGQRELIIGDRKLGKSTIAQDIIINQKNTQKPVRCIYVACGEKEQKMEELISVFENNNTFLYTTVVSSTAEESFASQYLAPFVGCAIGEYFRDRGEDALIIYDDLSTHAKIYRSISLLLGRAPGREAYPGDIFSLHAGLLERAAKLSNKNKGGSLTALPIIETQEGDITSFIPTNLISITDGQIYLERGLFQKGFLPAVNVGLSVSRVGSKAQPRLLKEVVEGIRLSLAQHKELQKLVQLETVISKKTQEKIHRGELTLELLKQEKRTNVSWEEQVVLFYAVKEGFFDDMSGKTWSSFEKKLLEFIRNHPPFILDEIAKGFFDDKLKEKIKKVILDSKKEFSLN